MSNVGKIKKRRNRVSLVCSNCKEKKIKCNRQQPCSNCIRSSLISSCTYNYNFKKINDCTYVTEQKKPQQDVGTGDITPAFIEDTNVDNEYLGTAHQASILDVEFNDVKEYNVFRKPSNTQLRPAFHSAYMRQKHILSYKFLLPFKQLLNNERRLWKSKNFDKNFLLEEVQYGRLNMNRDCKLLDQSIEKLICNNYYAVLERLQYFQTELNKILFNSYIPMGVVQLIFHYYFNIKKDGVVFKRPKKNFEYSFISLISSLVELTNIFTRYSNQDFNFPLPQQNNEFNELSVKLLNASNYRRKRTIFAVYTLLNLRLSLMIYGDAQSGGVTMQNTHPIFQSAVSICTEMGLHVDQDKVSYFEPPPNVTNGDEHLNELMFAKEIPTNSIKLLWNYLLLADATYYIDLYVPPFIDDRFCHGFYPLEMREGPSVESILKVVKEISYNLFSGKPICLRKINEYLQRLNTILSSIGSFADFKTFEKNEDKWQSFYMMFKILKLIYTYEFKIYALLDDSNLTLNYSKEVLNDKQNQEIIRSMRNECGTKCKLIFFIAISTLVEMSQGNLSYKFLLYNREIFSTWIGLELIILIDMILTDGKELKKRKPVINSDTKENFKLPDPPVFDIAELEQVLFNFNTTKHSQLLFQIEDACEPESILSFLSNVYENIINVPALFSDYKFFVMTKLFFLTIYFLYSYIESHCDDSHNSVYNNLDNLKVLTQKIISKHLQEGRLSHLLPTHQIITQLRERDDQTGEVDNTATSSTKFAYNTNNTARTYEDGGNGTVNWTPDSLSSANSMLPSQFDDIASAIFEDEGMVNILNEINEYFNQLES